MCLLILVLVRVGNMNKNTQIYIGIAALAAVGLYFYMKQKSDLNQFKNSYNVLADQLASGKLVTNTAQQ